VVETTKDLELLSYRAGSDTLTFVDTLRVTRPKKGKKKKKKMTQDN